MNIPQAMLDEIDAKAEEMFSTRSSAVRWLFRNKWSDSTPTCINLHQPASECINQHTPTPTRARKRFKSSSDSGEKKKKEKREKRGSVRGGQADLLGTESPRMAEPSVRRVIEHLNATCGTELAPADDKVREHVNTRLTKNSLEEMELVHCWAAVRWKDEEDRNGTNWRDVMVVPSNLYGSKFGEYLSSAKRWKKRELSEPKEWTPPAEEML